MTEGRGGLIGATDCCNQGERLWLVRSVPYGHRRKGLLLFVLFARCILFRRSFHCIVSIPCVQERSDHGPHDVALIVSQPTRVDGEDERIDIFGFISQCAYLRRIYSECVGHLLDGFGCCPAAPYEPVHSRGC